MEKIVGRVIRFGDNINTTIMAPHEIWGHDKPMSGVTMTAIRPTFPQEVRPGDIIVAGTNWGCGSHRDDATQVFIKLGVKAIVADSMARIYYRMCLAYGLPVFTCMGVSEMFVDGNLLELNLETGKVTNITTGKTINGSPLPEFLLELLMAGGMLPFIVEQHNVET